MGIKLRGRNIAVPHHFLNGTEIRAIFQQVHRKAMAQGVGGDLLFDLRCLLVVLQYFPEALAAHPFTTDVDKECILLVCCQ